MYIDKSPRFTWDERRLRLSARFFSCFCSCTLYILGPKKRWYTQMHYHSTIIKTLLAILKVETEKRIGENYQYVFKFCIPLSFEQNYTAVILLLCRIYTSSKELSVPNCSHKCLWIFLDWTQTIIRLRLAWF